MFEPRRLTTLWASKAFFVLSAELEGQTENKE
jgi:hypothetical protein